MKLFKLIIAVTISIFVLFVSACKKEIQGNVGAAMISETEIVEPAIAHTKTLTVYADGAWQADVTESWLSINPASGKGTTSVELAFDVNDSDDPRSAELVLIVNGYNGQIKAGITQKGDKYRNMKDISVTEALALKENDMVKLKECCIMAFTTSGFILSDGSSAIYVDGKTEYKLGSKITATGIISNIDGMLGIKLEDALLVEEGKVEYPQAKNITSSIAAYNPQSIEYVTIEASCSGTKLLIDEKAVGTIYNPVAALGIKKYDLHNIALTAYCAKVGGVFVFIPVSIEDRGLAAQIYLGFEIETAEFKSANPSFGTEHSFKAVKGDGYIKYFAEDLAGTDPDGVWKMDISGKDPRCTGPFIGDYWLFYGNAPIKSGSVVRIKFGTRVSKTGCKYWILEYLDGKTWKIAGTPKVSNDSDIPPVVYTHQQAGDGATNITVDETVTFSRNVEHGQFRFRSVTSKQANDGAVLTKRNTGSARLAVESEKNTAPQPTIIIVSEGDGSAADPVPANITVSISYLAFDGTPDAAKNFKVNSDQSYTVTSTADWLKLDAEGGSANEEKIINVTCLPSELAVYREAKIVLTSGDTVKEIPVIQSAAGQTLKPLISITNGSVRREKGLEHTFSVEYQANTNCEVTTDVDWLTVEPKTKAVVTENSALIKCSSNLSSSPRTGHVIVKNESLNVLAIVVVIQDVFNPVDLEITKASGFAATYDFPATVNVALTMTSDSDWAVVASEIEVGASVLSVKISANDTGASRQAKITFKNAEFDLEKQIVITQAAKAASGSVFEDDFSWMDPMIAFYKTKVPAKPIGKSVEDNNASGVAPNAYTDANIIASGLMTEFANRGYEDLNPAGKVLYPQDAYWKMGKTNVHTGLKLPPFHYVGDVTLTFDWCPHMTGSGNIDKVNAVVEVVGSGKVVTAIGLASVSDPFENNWIKKKLEWHGATAKIKGLKVGDRLIVRPQYLSNHDGISQMRWYIDNIRAVPGI